MLISTHVCHPSLANDNLSGIAVATFLARALAELPRRLSYRFLFVPGHDRRDHLAEPEPGSVSRIKHGLVLTGVGDSGHARPTSGAVAGTPTIDRAVAHVLGHSGGAHDVLDFSPYGYDERQYCSPGFDLPVGCFMRTPWGRYPEYHTSADDLELRSAGGLADSFEKVLAIALRRRGRRRVRESQPVRRAAARPARPVPAGRRPQGRERRRARAALGAEPLRRPALAARHRRAVGPRVRRRSGLRPTRSSSRPARGGAG